MLLGHMVNARKVARTTKFFSWSMREKLHDQTVIFVTVVNVVQRNYSNKVCVTKICKYRKNCLEPLLTKKLSIYRLQNLDNTHKLPVLQVLHAKSCKSGVVEPRGLRGLRRRSLLRRRRPSPSPSPSSLRRRALARVPLS